MLYGCLLLYITLIYVRPAEIVPGWETIPFVQILTGISIVIGIFSFAHKPRRVTNLPHDKLVLAFWGAIVISSVKIWLMGAFNAWLAFMPSAFCYFLFRAAVRTKAQLKGVIYLLIALNVFLAVNGIVQYNTGVGLGNMTMTLERIYGTGIFSDPNDLGMTFVMSIPFLVLLLAGAGKALLTRVIALIAIGLILLATYYTNSRGAIVGLSAAMIAYSFTNFKKSSAMFVGAILVAVIAVAAPSRAGEMSYGESSAQTRIQSWAAGWSMLKTHPVTGVGYDQYTEYNEVVAHNSFVHTFAELGLVGAFCFVGMFYWYFRGLRKLSDTPADMVPWRNALIASGTGSLACCWFLSRQYVAVLYVLLAMGATAAILESDAPDASVPITSRDGWTIAGLTICGIAAVYISIRTMAVWSGG